MPETETPTETAKPATPSAAVTSAKANWGRRRLRAEARNKRKIRLATDREFAKTYFEARSKRSTEKKSTFRKKKTKKK